MEHRLKEDVKLDEINKIKDSLKMIKFRMMTVLDYKKNILPMKYRKVQVEYYVKKGMSMIEKWK